MAQSSYKEDAPAAPRKQSRDGAPAWLSLGQARTRLGVAEGTLRKWADSGHVRSFRTPGGHRRFAPDDIVALQNGETPPAQDQDNAELAVNRVRRQLQDSLQTKTWYQNLSEPSRSRLRLMGRRLMEITMQYYSRKQNRAPLLTEVREIGQDYGHEMAAANLALADLMEAFAFHQRSAADSIEGVLLPSTTPEEALQMGKEIALVGIEVLFAMVRAWETAGTNANRNSFNSRDGGNQ